MEQEERFMIIKTGAKHYGLKINDIKEVVPNTEITNAHNADSAYIYGIMNCRYGCVSVFDIYKLFHAKPVSIPRIAIIIVFDEGLLAFPVEIVEGVVNVVPEKIYGIPQVFDSVSQRYVQMVIELDGKLIPILDTKRLFEKTGILSETKIILE